MIMENQGFRITLSGCNNCCDNCGNNNKCNLATTNTYPICWTCDNWIK